MLPHTSGVHARPGVPWSRVEYGYDIPPKIRESLAERPCPGPDRTENGSTPADLMSSDMITRSCDGCIRNRYHGRFCGRCPQGRYFEFYERGNVPRHLTREGFCAFRLQHGYMGD